MHDRLVLIELMRVPVIGLTPRGELKTSWPRSIGRARYLSPALVLRGIAAAKTLGLPGFASLVSFDGFVALQAFYWNPWVRKV